MAAWRVRTKAVYCLLQQVDHLVQFAKVLVGLGKALVIFRMNVPVQHPPQPPDPVANLGRDSGAMRGHLLLQMRQLFADDTLLGGGQIIGARRYQHGLQPLFDPVPLLQTATASASRAV